MEDGRDSEVAVDAEEWLCVLMGRRLRERDPELFQCRLRELKALIAEGDADEI